MAYSSQSQPPAGVPLLPPPPPPSGHVAPSRRSSPPAWAVFLILLGGMIVMGVLIAGVLSMNAPIPDEGAESMTVSKLTTFSSPPTVPPELSVLQENETPVPMVVPNAVQVGEMAYTVVPVMPEQGRWPIPSDPNVAVWLFGTVVNYVVGIPYTATVEAHLAGLRPGALITLTLDNGTALIFSVTQVQRIAPDDLSPMAQTQPGLTLAMLGSATADRLVVQARYLPDQTEISDRRQRVGALIVEVLKAGMASEGAEGRYFVVEYRVTNEGNAPVQAQLFATALEDGHGNRYLPNPEGTRLGEHGPLTGTLPAGGQAVGSVGYLVPDDLAPPLTWLFSPEPTAMTARYVLPYSPPPPTPPWPEVTLTSAFVDGARGVIVIEGTVRNAGGSPLTVTLEDVRLTSSVGESALQASTPLLPWTVEEGATQPFELQFSRPTGAEGMLFEMLGYTFQLQ